MTREPDEKDGPLWQSWITHAVEHLRAALSDYPWTIDAGIALGHILHSYRFEFVDGYVLNDYRVDGGLGYADAAMVVSRVCTSPVRSWSQWQAGFVSPQDTTSAYETVREDLLSRLRSAPAVKSIG